MSSSPYWKASGLLVEHYLIVLDIYNRLPYLIILRRNRIFIFYVDLVKINMGTFTVN
jgi:hypothetical protein